MKKQLPDTLKAFLQSHQEYQRADLFLVNLTNGQSITATTWQLDAANAGTPPTTFYATRYGSWSRGDITSTAMMGNLASQTMSLSVSIPNDTQVFFPGTNVPLFQTVSTGLFDKAQVWVYTAYSPLNAVTPNPHPNGFDTSLGFEIKFMGEITNVDSLTRSKCTFTVADLLYRLNLATPPNIIQSPCRFTLFDQHCALSSASFQVAAQVASGSTNLTINTTAALPSVGTNPLPYALGVVKFTSGQNTGMAAKIKQQNSTTQFVLDAPFILPIQVSDQMTVQPGCDLLFSTCQNTFSNSIHYGGFQFIPQPETVL
jgi:hypothetical protein